MNIGIKIRRLRILHGLTQEELANRCELTKGFISQLENDLTSPTILTLNDILVALGTNLGDFFKIDEEEKIVWTDEDYFVKENSDSTITWLVPNSQKNEMEPIIFTLNPNCETVVDMPHEGEEFGYVLDGSILVNIGGNEYECHKGESFYYVTNKKHYLKNKENEIAKVLWISTPPNF